MRRREGRKKPSLEEKVKRLERKISMLTMIISDLSYQYEPGLESIIWCRVLRNIEVDYESKWRELLS